MTTTDPARCRGPAFATRKEAEAHAVLCRRKVPATWFTSECAFGHFHVWGVA